MLLLVAGAGTPPQSPERGAITRYWPLSDHVTWILASLRFPRRVSIVFFQFSDIAGCRDVLRVTTVTGIVNVL